MEGGLHYCPCVEYTEDMKKKFPTPYTKSKRLSFNWFLLVFSNSVEYINNNSFFMYQRYIFYIAACIYHTKHVKGCDVDMRIKITNHAFEGTDYKSMRCMCQVLIKRGVFSSRRRVRACMPSPVPLRVVCLCKVPQCSGVLVLLLGRLQRLLLMLLLLVSFDCAPRIAVFQTLGQVSKMIRQETDGVLGPDF